MKNYVFGIDVGGTSIKCGLFSMVGEVLDKWEIATVKETAFNARSTDVDTKNIILHFN
jgi:glucokinase